MKKAVASVLRKMAFLLSPEEAASPVISRADVGPPEIDAFMLGLKDAAESGWFNNPQRELYTGFPVGPENTVLDLGCGDGGMSAFCSRMGASVFFADVDTEKVEATRQRLAGISGARYESVSADGAGVRLVDAAVDRVVCTEVLEHVEDVGIMLRELYRVGKPGALYLLSVPSQVSEDVQKGVAPDIYFAHPHHIRVFREGELAASARALGLEVLSESRYGFFWFLWWMIMWADAENRKDVLNAWARTWHGLTSTPAGLKIATALNSHLGKSDVIVARKPLSDE